VHIRAECKREIRCVEVPEGIKLILDSGIEHSVRVLYIFALVDINKIIKLYDKHEHAFMVAHC
jgi:hypothetical protein